MDAWSIVVLPLAAIALIVLLVERVKKRKQKRERERQELRDRRLKAEQERIAPEQQRARAMSPSVNGSNEHDWLAAELHTRRARQIDPDSN